MPAIPDYQTLMLPVLRLAADGETTIPRVVERLAKEFSLTPDQLVERIPSGRSAIINSRAAWAKTYLLQAGLLEQPRRSWFRASDKGREILSKNLTRIDKEFLLQFPGFKAFLERFYGDMLPAINSRQLDLLDDARLVAQIVGLERRTARGGRDIIDHAPGWPRRHCERCCWSCREADNRDLICWLGRLRAHATAGDWRGNQTAVGDADPGGLVAAFGATGSRVRLQF